MRTIFIVWLCLTRAVSYAQISTFSNTTTAGCNTWDSGNLYTGFTRNITVSGLPTPLGTGGGQVALRQVNLQLGNSSGPCNGNLSSYNARLISPGGTIIQLFQPFTTTSTAQWFNIKYRDNGALERVTDYSTVTKQNYWPWSIGYYRTTNANAYAAVNGEDPNGTWVLQIQENTASEVSFERVDLVFGPQIAITNIVGSSANDACAGSQCLDTKSVIVATDSAFTSPDPNYPGSPVGACSWNGANNNSAWFQFTANASTAYLTVSGLANNPSSTSFETQLIVASRTGGCASGTWSIPSGGCADNESINNGSYLTTNGGGVGTSGNVYFDGISANAEFNLSGLTIGQVYYLYVDGNGGTPSRFYIEMLSGADDCGPLPVELTYFDVLNYPGKKAIAKWTTATEINNDFFEIEKSTDAINFESIGRVNGAGNSNINLSHSFIDNDPILRTTYYRLKQVDYDGQYKYYGPRVIYPQSITETAVYPNPTNDIVYLEFNSDMDEKVEILVIDVCGKIIKSYVENIMMNQNIKSIDLSDVSAGTYFILLNGNNLQFKTKVIKQ
jgi:hypothetical protein